MVGVLITALALLGSEPPARPAPAEKALTAGSRFPLREWTPGREVITDAGVARRLELVERCLRVTVPGPETTVPVTPKPPPTPVLRQERVPKHKPRQAQLAKASRRVRAMILGLDDRRASGAPTAVAAPEAPLPVDPGHRVEWHCTTEYAGGSPPDHTAIYREDAAGRWQVAVIQGGRRRDFVPPVLVLPAAPVLEVRWSGSFRKDDTFNDASLEVVRPNADEARACKDAVVIDRSIASDHGTRYTYRDLYCPSKGRIRSSFSLKMGKRPLTESRLELGVAVDAGGGEGTGQARPEPTAPLPESSP